MITNRLVELPPPNELSKAKASATTQSMPSTRAAAFVACPTVLMGGFEFWQQCLYQIAYAQAREQVQARREAQKAAAMWN